MTTISIQLIVEDPLSEAVAMALLNQTQKPFDVCSIWVWSKGEIQKNINWVNNASRGLPYFVLTDQDTREACPPKEIKRLIRNDISRNLIYRFAAMEVEAWVMAHRRAFAGFLSIPEDQISPQPDRILNPKEHLISLARKTRISDLREALVPAPESTSKVGPDYNGRLCEFVQKRWRAGAAAKNSPSLARALNRLREFRPV